MPAALLAVCVVLTGRLLGWRGVDTAAQTYRVDAFRHHGFTLFDLQWYGGHWTPDYSVAYPPVAAVLGTATVAVLSAGLAALAFDRLVRPALGAGGGAASLLFALGTAVPAAIGQLTFLSGEALALAALWALSRDRRVLPSLLALAAALTSPLAGLFLALAVAGHAVHGISSARSRGAGPAEHMVRTALQCIPAVAAVAPAAVAAVVFPGDGAMPYPAEDWLWELAVAAAVAGLARRRQPGVAAGAVLFMVVATISFAVRSPLGGNVGRLEDAVALPLTAVLAWQATGLQRAGRWPARLKVRAPASLRVAVVTLVGVPLLLSQWSPAWADLTTTGGTPTSRASYFAPLDAALRTWFAADPAGRVEVVPTAYHAEAAYVAAAFPLARGWERQLDVADNPIFYRPAALTPAGYRTWLLDNGVRFVALSSAPLDPAGRAEGRLVASGLVPGLRLVWTSPDWHLYLVLGSTGIVSGPATLIAAGRDGAIVSARSAGTVTVRLRQPSAWRVEGGPACVSAAPSPWVLLEVSGPGVIRLSVGPHQPWGHRPTCPPGA